MSAKNILIVDDSATTGNLIRLHMENLGYRVTALANSAEKSLQAIEQELPDLVLIEDLLRTMYKLSPTEARIASRLVFNPYLADVSATLGITYQTARTHLKRIYQKTETKRLPALIQKIVTGPAGLFVHTTD